MTASRQSTIRVVLAIAILTTIIALTSSCQGSRLATPVAKTPEAPPYVEAFLEYVGPPDKWAGPKTVSYRILAKAPEARAELRELGGSMAEPPLSFNGCLYPIRARLLRSDGSVLERQGCRGHAGWPVAAGRVVSGALETAHQDKSTGSKTAQLATKHVWQLK